MEIAMKIRLKAGFTLLEMLVSVGVIAVISVVLSQVFIVTLRTNTKTELLKDIKQNGELALETMMRMIQSAKNVTCPTTQSVTVTGPDDGVTTFECSLSGSVTRIASTSAAGTKYLTADNTTLGGSNCAASSLAFACAGGVGVPVSVTIGFRLSQAGVSGASFEEVSESFQTSVTTRNTPQ